MKVLSVADADLPASSLLASKRLDSEQIENRSLTFYDDDETSHHRGKVKLLDFSFKIYLLSFFEKQMHSFKEKKYIHKTEKSKMCHKCITYAKLLNLHNFCFLCTHY